jgi:hypothetical protein
LGPLCYPVSSVLALLRWKGCTLQVGQSAPEAMDCGKRTVLAPVTQEKELAGHTIQPLLSKW